MYLYGDLKMVVFASSLRRGYGIVGVCQSLSLFVVGLFVNNVSQKLKFYGPSAQAEVCALS